MRGNLDINGPPISIRDEGAAQGTVSAINFVGAGVSATVSGAVATITISASTDQAAVLKLVSLRG